MLPLQPRLPLHRGCDRMPWRAREERGASGQMTSWEQAPILQCSVGCSLLADSGTLVRFVK